MQCFVLPRPYHPCPINHSSLIATLSFALLSVASRIDRDRSLSIDWEEWRDFFEFSSSETLDELVQYWRHSVVSKNTKYRTLLSWIHLTFLVLLHGIMLLITVYLLCIRFILIFLFLCNFDIALFRFVHFVSAASPSCTVQPLT